jgi:hypothetical protein
MTLSGRWTERFGGPGHRLNFSELPANTLLGWLGSERKSWLHAWDEQCNEVGAQYFFYANNEIRLKTPMMPAMLSCDSRVVRQDCLCYLMERTTVDDDAVEQPIWWR